MAEEQLAVPDDELGLLPDWDAVGDDEIIDSGIPIFDVIHVEVTGPLTLAVAFEDGLKGTVRFMPHYLHGHYAKLADSDYFARVGLAHGAVSWPNEDPDLSPTRMYDEIKAHGEWVLG